MRQGSCFQQEQRVRVQLLRKPDLPRVGVHLHEVVDARRVARVIVGHGGKEVEELLRLLRGIHGDAHAFSSKDLRPSSIAACTMSGAGAPGIRRFSTQESIDRSSNTSASNAG